MDMTEAEWLNCENSETMFAFLIARARSRRSPLPHRQFRLFACACCRRVWPLLADEQSRQAVIVSERFADGLAKRSEVERACRAAGRVQEALKDAKGRRAAYLAARMAMWASTDSIQDVAGGTADEAENLAASRDMAAPVGGSRAARRGESKRQCDLFRDLFGNPFRATPAVERSWLAWGDGVVPRLARAVYDERAFERLPILADALEEAGCTRADVLTHCRSDGPHVRGCWVVDWLLGTT
jgi:hypothetical protein